jgi:hypothetical protein
VLSALHARRAYLPGASALTDGLGPDLGTMTVLVR